MERNWQGDMSLGRLYIKQGAPTLEIHNTSIETNKGLKMLDIKNVLLLTVILATVTIGRTIQIEALSGSASYAGLLALCMVTEAAAAVILSARIITTRGFK